MKKNKHFYIFVGTTAELIKLAPVIKELKRRRIRFKLITSGQNEILFDELRGITGPLNVDIAFAGKGEKSSIFNFALWSVKTFFACLFSLQKEFRGLNKKNSYFIVHGDTVSSLLGALVASIYKLKLVHIESGLRSFNFLEPFPEEISRYIVSRLADIHFCPNEWAVNNLNGYKGEKIDTYQNTLIESFWMAMNSKKTSQGSIDLKYRYFVLVAHRQEHVIFRKEWIKELLQFVLKNSDKDLKCVFIMHPLTSSLLKSEDVLSKKIKNKVIPVPRLPYIQFVKLLSGAEYLVTDGGSNQEEAYYLGLPCLILRRRTERIEGLGKNAVLSKGQVKMIKRFLKDYKKYRSGKTYPKRTPSRIIVDYLTGE